MIKLRKFILLLLILFSLITINYASENDFQLLEINLINQNPNPVYSGDFVELILGIENKGYGIINDLSLEFEENYPFKILSEKKFSFSSIFSGTNYVQTIKINLKIENDIRSGIYPLKIKEIIGELSKEHIIYVSVNSNKNIEILSIDENSILPGEVKNISFRIKNIGNSILRDIDFSWENKDNILLPINSDNKVFINNLDINEEKILSFLIGASPSAESNLYKLDLEFNFANKDDSSINIQKSSSGFYVGGTTNFDIIFNQESLGESVFTILNTGANNVNAIKVSIDKSSDWKSLGKNSEIIGNLNKGDYTSFSFVFLNNNANLIFNIEYTDTFGNRVSEIKKISFNGENLNGTANLSQRTSRTNSQKDSLVSNTRSPNPMANMEDGFTKISTWSKYAFYGLIFIIIMYLVFRTYKKKSAKKDKEN